jgi:hypothetical protein
MCPDLLFFPLNEDEKVFANTPTNSKGNKIFYTLFAQHVSTLTWVLFSCSKGFPLNGYPP